MCHHQLGSKISTQNMVRTFHIPMIMLSSCPLFSNTFVACFCFCLFLVSPFPSVHIIPWFSSCKSDTLYLLYYFLVHISTSTILLDYKYVISKASHKHEVIQSLISGDYTISILLLSRFICVVSLTRITCRFKNGYDPSMRRYYVLFVC